MLQSGVFLLFCFVCWQILEGKSKMISVTGTVIRSPEHLEAVLDVCGPNLKEMESSSSDCFSGINRDRLLQLRLEWLSIEKASIETIPFVECFCGTMKFLNVGIVHSATFWNVVECLHRLARALKAGGSECLLGLRIRVLLSDKNVQENGAGMLLNALNDVFSCIPNVEKLELFFHIRADPDIEIDKVICNIGVLCPKLTKLNMMFQSKESGDYWDLFANPEFLKFLRKLSVSYDRVEQNALYEQLQLRKFRPVLSVLY